MKRRLFKLVVFLLLGTIINLAVARGGDAVLFPIGVIEPGFAINTVFYAAILWLLTLGPFTARRMIRRKRGRCIKCGYDLRGAEHAVCPECGVER